MNKKNKGEIFMKSYLLGKSEKVTVHSENESLYIKEVDGKLVIKKLKVGDLIPDDIRKEFHTEAIE